MRTFNFPAAFRVQFSTILCNFAANYNTMKKLSLILAAIALLSISCQTKKVNKIEGTAFGTIYHIVYTGPESATLKQQVDSVLADVNKTFSIFDTTSLISRINRGETDLGNDDLLRVLRASLKVSEQTDGAFDCTIQPLIELWGFGRQNQKQVVPQALIDSVLQFTGCQRVGIDQNRILKEDSRTQLNFNAIAKGFAVDKIGQYLEHKGYKDFIVEIGGEVVTRGKKNGKPWKVGIQVPTQTADDPVESNETFTLENKAVATSGDYRNFFEKDGLRYTHILDPKTGKPEQTNLLSVSVITTKCAVADAYATAFMVLGIDKSSEIVKNDPQLEAYFIFDNNGKYKVEHVK